MPKVAKTQSNPWNEFRTRHAGKGYSMKELSAMYKSERTKSASATASASTTGVAVVRMQKKQKGQALELPEVDVYIAPKLPRGQVGINTNAWNAVKPITKDERQVLLDVCGPGCFLIPEDMKYPVCAKDNTCKHDCSGIRAARNLTHLIVNRRTVSHEAKLRALNARSKANELGAAHCGWVKK